MSACCPSLSRWTSNSGSPGASRATVSQYLVKRYTENSQADSQSPCDCVERFGWEAWTRTRIARSRVWSPTDWTTSQQCKINKLRGILMSQSAFYPVLYHEQTSKFQ